MNIAPTVTTGKALGPHAAYIGAHMREADRRETFASSGRAPLDIAQMSLAASAMAWAATIEGRPVAMWGVVPTEEWATGAVWLLATEEIGRMAWLIAREAGSYVSVMHGAFPRLGNFVAADNVNCQRWLRRLGFTVEAEVHHRRRGVDFKVFWRESHV